MGCKSESTLTQATRSKKALEFIAHAEKIHDFDEKKKNGARKHIKTEYV